MGCFSFLCKKCDKGIESSSFDGDECRLSLLKDGKVIQEMEGEYDSYGRVFINDTQKSQVWKDPFPEKAPTNNDQYFIDKKDDHWIWLRVCSLLHSNDNSNGIAAYCKKCDNGEIPTTRSDNDPNQGWGDRG